jgi:hypothetical protein
MTADVAAAVEGLFEGGATAVEVQLGEHHRHAEIVF